MGKQRRQRLKFHIPASNTEKKLEQRNMDVDSQPILMIPPENLFTGINIDLSHLKKDLAIDNQSQKSDTRVKKSQSDDKIQTKKEKLKLRHNILLKKIDAVNQMKLEVKRRRKRKNVSIIGDTNPLYDALPALEPLKCKQATDFQTNLSKFMTNNKRKGTEKAVKRKRQAVQGVQIYKSLMKNKGFQKDPLKAISEHISTVVQHTKNMQNRKL